MDGLINCIRLVTGLLRVGGGLKRAWDDRRLTPKERREKHFRESMTVLFVMLGLPALCVVLFIVAANNIPDDDSMSSSASVPPSGRGDANAAKNSTREPVRDGTELTSVASNPIASAGSEAVETSHSLDNVQMNANDADADAQQLDSSRRQLDSADNRKTYEIKRFLEGWADAHKSNDPHIIAAYYAPRLTRYFLKSDVDNDFVVDENARIISKSDPANNLVIYEIQGLEISAIQDEAIIKLVKHSKGFLQPHGVVERDLSEKFVRSELQLRDDSTGWKIVSERDFKN